MTESAAATAFARFSMRSAPEGPSRAENSAARSQIDRCRPPTPLTIHLPHVPGQVEQEKIPDVLFDDSLARRQTASLPAARPPHCLSLQNYSPRGNTATARETLPQRSPVSPERSKRARAVLENFLVGSAERVELVALDVDTFRRPAGRASSTGTMISARVPAKAVR